MDGTAIVYCEGAFGTPNGKTANGLVRHTDRYLVMGVIDSKCAGHDAGIVLDGKLKNIPIFDSVDEAIAKLLMRWHSSCLNLSCSRSQYQSCFICTYWRKQ